MSIVIGFGVPIHESVEGATFASLATTWAAWLDIAPADWKLRIAPPRGCSVVENRNLATRELLRDGIELPDGRTFPGQDAPRSPLSTRPADVILWNDSDCCVDPEDYVRLVESLLAAPDDVAAIGYAAPMQSGDDRPRPNIGRPGGITFAAPGPVNLVEVDWIGFGIVATRASVYGVLDGGSGDGPWFQHVSGKSGRGEDIGWCRDVRAAGYKILCDVGVEIAHWYRAPHRMSDFYAQHHREG